MAKSRTIRTAAGITGAALAANFLTPHSAPAPGETLSSFAQSARPQHVVDYQLPDGATDASLGCMYDTHGRGVPPTHSNRGLWGNRVLSGWGPTSWRLVNSVGSYPNVIHVLPMLGDEESRAFLREENVIVDVDGKVATLRTDYPLDTGHQGLSPQQVTAGHELTGIHNEVQYSLAYYQGADRLGHWTLTVACNATETDRLADAAVSVPSLARLGGQLALASYDPSVSTP